MNRNMYLFDLTPHETIDFMINLVKKTNVADKRYFSALLENIKLYHLLILDFNIVDAYLSSFDTVIKEGVKNKAWTEDVILEKLFNEINGFLKVRIELIERENKASINNLKNGILKNILTPERINNLIGSGIFIGKDWKCLMVIPIDLNDLLSKKKNDNVNSIKIKKPEERKEMTIEWEN